MYFVRESVQGTEPKLVAPASFLPVGVFKKSGPPLSPEQTEAVELPFAHKIVWLSGLNSLDREFEQSREGKSVNVVSKATGDVAPSLEVRPKPEAMTEEKESE